MLHQLNIVETHQDSGKYSSLLKFLNKCVSSGVNGLIVVDLPWPENKDFAKKCKKKIYLFYSAFIANNNKTKA